MLLFRAVVSSEGSTRGWRVCFCTDQHGCWQDSVPHRMSDRGSKFPHWLLAGASLSFFPHGPLHRSVYNMASASCRCEQEKDQETGLKTEATAFL